MKTSNTLTLSIACSGGFHGVVLTPEGVASMEANHGELETQVIKVLGGRESNCAKALRSVELAQLSLRRLSRSESWPLPLREIRFSGNGKIKLTSRTIMECLSPAHLSKKEGLDPAITKLAREYYKNILFPLDSRLNDPSVNSKLLENYSICGWSNKESKNLWNCGVSPSMARIARLLGVKEVQKVVKMMALGWTDEHALFCEKVLPRAIEEGLPWQTWQTMPWPFFLTPETIVSGNFDLIKAEYTNSLKENNLQNI